MDIEIVNETRVVVARQWHLEIAESDSLELLIAALTERILVLLESDKDKLMRALYVLDVPEKRYNAAMKQRPVEHAARALAQAVLDRETEKIAMRRRYAQSRDGYLSDAFDDEGTKP